MKQQLPLFEIAPDYSVTTVKKLTIKGKPKTLSKTQKEFNHLTRKIETLRKRIKDDTENYDQTLEYYHKNIEPIENQQAKIDEQLVKKLYNRLYSVKNKLTKNQQNKFHDYLYTKLENVLSLKLPDDELKQIFEDLEGVSFEDFENGQMDAAKEGFANMFREMGVDVDFNDIDFKADPEEIHRKIQEKKEQVDAILEEQEAKQSSRKKSKKALAQELKEKQQEAIKKQNINSIYKQLAKLLRPDLEKDEDTRKKKEELMKKVTAAYKENDLYALLSLEAQWIHNESKHLNTIADDKLAIYIEVLRQQTEDLENELFMVENNPRYNELQKYGFFRSLPTISSLKVTLIELEEELKHDTQLLQKIEKGDVENEVKKMLKTYYINNYSSIDLGNIFH